MQLLEYELRPFVAGIRNEKKALGTAVRFVGAVVAVASLFADSIGIGSRPGFGLYQAIGLVVGAIVMTVGFYVAVKSQ